MLPSSERLSRAAFNEFLEIPGHITVYNRLGTFKFKKTPSFRISVVTSSKHEKRAVVRNTLRRRVYSRFSTLSCSMTGILYTSKQSYSFTFSEIKSLHEDLIAKAQKASQ